MSKQKKNMSGKGYYSGRDDPDSSEASGKSKKGANWSQGQQEILDELKKEIRVVEEKLGREMRVMQENYEKKITTLAKQAQKNTEENNTLKNKIGQMAKEACKSTEEKNSLKTRVGQMEKDVQKFSEEKNFLRSRIGQMEKEVQNLTEEKNSLKMRIGQVEANDNMRHQETVRQSRKNERIEENVKYLIGKTNDLENRSRRDHLRIIGLPECHDQKKSLETIFQEIIKENCPNILYPEGKIEIERIHRSPPEKDPKMKGARDVIAKFQNPLMKERILQAVRKRPFKYRGATVRITQDLAPSTLKERRAWNVIFRRAKELGLQPRITYPAKLSIIIQGRRWAYNDIDEFHAFLMKRPDLNRKFDIHKQDAKRHRRANIRE
uniref:L1 transposable element RRM domain-containing protein n=1 Tax=Sarcophilus harrisii TaxID=9305 RepID=A0A7N4NVL6_SARHA